jgi:hypothetical protein
MKKSVSLIVALALVAVSSAASVAQFAKTTSNTAHRWATEASNVRTHAGSTAAIARKFPSNPLSPMISLPSGQDMLPMNGWWTQQSNGRALHNIQVDPSNPSKIHVVVTGNTSFDVNDTASAGSRVCYYCFSSDGGHHWGTPVVLQPAGTTQQRQGYADLVLMNRNGEYVPVIICHRYWPAGRQEVYTTLYIEKGHAGDGNFTQSLFNTTVRKTVDGTTGDVIWPSLALSPDNKTVYAIASVSPGTIDELQFGKFTLNENRDSAASFSGWIAKPGDYAGTPQLGLTYGGDYRMYVAPSGRIGVAWECLPSQQLSSPVEDPMWNIMYSESNDGGATWSQEPITIASIDADQDANGMQARPTGEFDFWFDGPGDTAKFVYTKYSSDLQDITSTGKGSIPNSTKMWFKSLSRPTDSLIAATTDSVNDYANPMYLQNGFVYLNTLGVDLIDISMIGYPTVALTSDPKRLAVFYKAYTAGDFGTISDDSEGTEISRNYLYGNIYYSETKNGGWSWSAPKPFLTNENNATHIDYSYPQTSRWNPIVGGLAHYEILFSADSAPGWVYQNGTVPGFGLIYYGHATAIGTAAGVSTSAEAVHASLSISPNPFSANSVVTVTTENPENVSLVLRDALGRDVQNFQPTHYTPGHSQSYTLDAKAMNLTPGVYFVTAIIGNSELTREAVFVK